MAEATQIQVIDIVERIFSNWTALKMAVEYGMGSKAEARSFCEYVAGILTMNEEQMHYSDLSPELEEYLDQFFNTRLEDGSDKQVAEDLVKFHLYMIKKDTASLQSEFARLPSRQPWIEESSAVQDVKNDSDSESDEMDTDNDNGKPSVRNTRSKGGMEVDEDGWAVVQRKR